MFQFLTAPYPFHRNFASGLAFAIGAGAFVALFLLVFQPFGTREFVHENKQLFLAGYGLVIGVTIWLGGNVPPLALPKLFDEERWTVGKHILYSTLVFMLVFAACYVYKDVGLGRPVSWRGFWGFLPFAFSIAIFPIAGLVIGNYVLQLKHHSKIAEAAVGHLNIQEVPLAQPPLSLPDENGRMVLEIDPSKLLYLQAADNYVEVFYLENGHQPRRTVLRNSLTNLEAILAGAGLIRCHRSYLVNLRRVERVSGNAQGYRLHFIGLEASVPVARGRSAKVLEILQ